MSRPPFVIPPLSTRFFSNLNLDLAKPTAFAALASFEANDHARNKGDPSRCDWIVSIRPPDGPRGWCAKGSIDADGPAVGVGYHDGVEMDPSSGQIQTTMRFPNGHSLPSEGVPYAVLPGGDFGAQIGLAIGDMCVVIYRDQITAAVFGDIGPGTGPGRGNPKIGEYSIRVHKRLRPAAPDPCIRRDHMGRCVRIRNASIEGGVICIGFPNSLINNLVLETCQAQIEEKAFALWEAAGGLR